MTKLQRIDLRMPIQHTMLDGMTPSDTYTHGHHDSVLRSHRWRTAENSAAYLLPFLQPGLSVLDVGCGPGTITADLARRDAAPLDEARDVAAGLANVRFARGDIYALEADRGSVDVVHAHQVLQHLVDPVAALVELRLVCRPGGLVAVRDVDYSTMTWFPLDPLLDRWQELYQAVARSNGGEPDAGRRLLAWAHAAGFEDVRASASAWCFATPGDRDWWADLWADRITRSRVADQALAEGHATRNELGAIAAAFRRWAVDPDAWWAMIHGEILCTAPATGTADGRGGR
jgi:SAM-dependent methyltransferase